MRRYQSGNEAVPIWGCGSLESVHAVRQLTACLSSAVLNCVRLLTRILPFLFEAPDWRLLFWSPANFVEVKRIDIFIEYLAWQQLLL